MKQPRKPYAFAPDYDGDDADALVAKGLTLKAEPDHGCVKLPTKLKRKPKPKATRTQEPPHVIQFRMLNDIAAGVAEGMYSGESVSKLTDHEREYVKKKAKSLRREQKRAEGHEKIMARQRAYEERFGGNPVVAAARLQEHHFYGLVSQRFLSRTPPMLQGGFIPNWSWFVTKKLNERALLAQLVYWFLPSHRPGKDTLARPRARLTFDTYLWVAKSDIDMEREIGVPVRTLKRCRVNLVRRGIVVVHYARFGTKGKRTCHYRLNWDVLEEAFFDGGGNGNLFEKGSKEANVAEDDGDDAPQPTWPIRGAGEEDEVDEAEWLAAVYRAIEEC